MILYNMIYLHYRFSHLSSKSLDNHLNMLAGFCEAQMSNETHKETVNPLRSRTETASQCTGGLMPSRKYKPTRVQQVILRILLKRLLATVAMPQWLITEDQIKVKFSKSVTFLQLFEAKWQKIENPLIWVSSYMLINVFQQVSRCKKSFLSNVKLADQRSEDPSVSLGKK